MAKNVTLVSKDGEHEIEFPEDDRLNINQYRALGWTTKQEHAKVEKKAESAK